MGWIHIVEHQEPHECALPTIFRWDHGQAKQVIGEGSLWECDVCFDTYEYTYRGWRNKGKSLLRQIEEAESTAGPTLTPKRKRWYNR